MDNQVSKERAILHSIRAKKGHRELPTSFTMTVINQDASHDYYLSLGAVEMLKLANLYPTNTEHETTDHLLKYIVNHPAGLDGLRIDLVRKRIVIVKFDYSVTAEGNTAQFANDCKLIAVDFTKPTTKPLTDAIKQAEYPDKNQNYKRRIMQDLQISESSDFVLKISAAQTVELTFYPIGADEADLGI